MIKYISRLMRAMNVNKVMTMNTFQKSSNEFTKKNLDKA